MPMSRTKACYHCRVAKSRCSLARPCSRCADRGLACQYPTAEAQQGMAWRQPRAIQPAVTPSSQTPSTPSAVDERQDSSTAICPTSAPSCDPTSNISWTCPGLSTGLPNTIVDGIPSSFFWMTTPIAQQQQQLQQVARPIKLSHLQTPGAFSIEAFFTTKMVLGQLLTYPHMVVSATKQLPPFIHPPCVLDRNSDGSQPGCPPETSHQCLPEPLAICASLLRMFHTRTPSSSAFVWEQIYSHHRHLFKEFRAYNSDTLLSALQVAIIYVLLQAGDPESIHKNDTFFLLVSTDEMARHFFSLFKWDVLSSPTSHPNRRRWIQEESAARTSCVLYIAKLVVDIDSHRIGQAVCPFFFSILAPCSRSLWEPVADREWHVRYQRDAAARAQQKTQRPSLGNLVSMRRSEAPFASSQSPPDVNQELSEYFKNRLMLGELSYWCENADEFGMLLWMTTMLQRKL